MKKIGLISDLHLESSNIDLPNPGWDYLVIAGDLSASLPNMLHFFNYYAPTDIPIIYVLGNHEYEGRRLDDNVEKIKEMLKPFSNVHVLDNESIVIDNIKFIGATLWSNFELEGIDKKKTEMEWAKFNIVDFTYIFDKNIDGRYQSISPERMVKLNEDAYKFLEYELKHNPFEGEKIVVTHFAPHKNSIHENHKNMMNSYWINNFEELMGFSKYWFHGHTHESLRYTVEGTEVVCNPRGHSLRFNISSNKNFDKELFLPIEIDNVLKIERIKIK